SGRADRAGVAGDVAPARGQLRRRQLRRLRGYRRLAGAVGSEAPATRSGRADRAGVAALGRYASLPEEGTVGPDEASAGPGAAGAAATRLFHRRGAAAHRPPGQGGGGPAVAPV